MFTTIKLNNSYWKKKFPGLKYGVPDPLRIFSSNLAESSEALTSFNFSGVFKTTQAGRHSHTQAFIKDRISEFTGPVTILDIGASDGSTSLDLINLLEGSSFTYYVTDYNIRCTYAVYKGITYFFNQEDVCFVAVSQKFVFYPANKWLFDLLFKRSLAVVKDLPKKELLLINKALQQKQQSNKGIEIMPFNIFEKWQKGNADVIIVGNLLHRSYFTDGQIEQALRNCFEVLTANGLLVIIRNSLTENGKEIENSTTYQKDSTSRTLKKLNEVNEGIDINSLVLSIQF